jgi:chemotaxis signal transduction protein
MALTVEQYSRLATDANGTIIPIPDAESFLGVAASGEALNAKCSYVIVTSDADDLIAIGLDGSEGTPAIPVKDGVPRPFRVPLNAGWAVTV